MPGLRRRLIASGLWYPDPHERAHTTKCRAARSSVDAGIGPSAMRGWRANSRSGLWLGYGALRDPPAGTHATISEQQEIVAWPNFPEGGTPTKIINIYLRRVWTGQFRSKPCSHVHLARADIGPASEVCVECVALGDSWPALRMCQLCGYVGCCDKSKNKHAREHFRQTGHPLTRPYKERGMDWVWCYVDEALLDPI